MFFKRKENFVLLRSNYFYIFLMLIFPFIFFYPYIFNNVLIYSVDGLNTYFPYRYFLYETISNGYLPLWWHYTHLGYPFIEVLQSSVFYPLNYIFLPLYKFNPFLAYNLGILLHLYILEIVIYYYINFLLKNRIISFIVSILYTFSGSSIGYVDFLTFDNSIPYFFLSLYNLHLIIYKNITRQEDFLKNILVYGISFGIIVLIGHPNIIVYTFIYSFIYILILLFIKKDYFGKVLFYWFLALGISLTIFWLQYMIFKEYSQLTGREYIKSIIFNYGSLSFELLINYFLPFIYNNYYYKLLFYTFEKTVNFEIVHYLSILAIPSLLFFIYKYYNRIKENRLLFIKIGFVMIIGFLSLLLSLGKNTIFHYIFTLIPFYLDIKSPVRQLFIFEFLLATSIGVFLKEILFIRSKIKENILIFIKFFIISFVLFIIIALIYFWYYNSIDLIPYIISLKFTTFYPLFFLIIFLILFIAYNKVAKRFFLFFILFFIIAFILEGRYYFYGIYKFKNEDNYEEFKKLFYFIYNDTKNNNNKNYNAVLLLNYNDNQIMYGTTMVNYISIITREMFFNSYDPILTFDRKELIFNNLFPFYFNLPLSFYSIKRIDLFCTKNEYKNNEVLDNLYNNFKYIYNVNYNIYKKLIKTYDILYSQKEIFFDSKNPIEFKIKNYNSPDIIGILILDIKLPKLDLFRYYWNNYYNNLILDKKKNINILLYDNSKFKVYLGNVNINYLKALKEKDSEYIKVMIPFSYFDVFDISNSKLIDFKIKLLTNEDQKIYLKNIKLVLYPPFLAPSFKNDNIYSYQFVEHKYLRKIIKSKDSQKKILRVTSIFYNNNVVNIIRSVNKINTVKGLLDFREKLYLLDFNILKEAKIEETEIAKIKKYSNLSNLNYTYKNIYKDLNQENINKLNFGNAKIMDENIFKKYNEISFKVKTLKDSFIVINHGYYKYWKAYINNTEVPVLKVNGMVMGVIVPKGEYEVILRYEPWYAKFFFLPFVTIAFYLLILFIILAKEKYYKKNKN